MSNRKSSYKLIIFAIALFVISLSASSAFSQVTVSGSTGANGAYTTVGAAFTAINGAGTQAGNNIVVEISANTAESGPAVLNSSDWTSLLVRPSADGVTVSGATTTGRGLIELNGADIVTIDGDNPNTGGTNRNLTFQNTAANTITYTSVIRVCVAATQISADFNIIRNLNLIGSATGRNAAANTSTTGSENTTFGVVAGGNGGASVPTAITSVTGTAPAGTTINLLSVDNNSIVSVARGVGFFGAAAANSTGVSITNNTIGGSGALVGDPPYTSPADTVYTKGVIVQGTTAVTVAGNTIRNILSYVVTTMAGIELTTAIGTGTLNVNNNSVTGVVNNNASGSGARGIDIASNTSTAASVSGNTVSNIQTMAGSTIFGVGIASTGPSGSLVVQKNKVTGVNSRGTGTFGAYGLSLNSGTAVAVRNNFIADVQHNMSGGGAFSTTFGVFGLRVAAGTNHQIYNNSVNLSAAYLGTPTSSLLSAAFAILGTGQTGIDVRNNIFANTNSGGTTSIAHVSVYLPSAGTSAMALTMNNNDYVFGADTARQGSGQAGTTAGTNFFTTFNPAAPSPASNLRSYTNTLNGVGNDDLSISADPQFNSPTDLHVSGVSPVLNIGATIGSVTDDIDGDARPAEGAYEIGADERLTVVSPGQIQLTAATHGGNEGTSVTITASRTSGTSGAVSVTYAMADVTATGGGACGGAVDYVNTGGSFNWGAGVGGTQSVNIPLCTDAGADPVETFTFTISAPTGGATLGAPSSSTVTITDVPPPFSGTITAGAGGTYTSITNAGGLFEAINLAGATSNLTINLVGDATGELGTNALNQIAGGFTVTIQPSGGARQIIGNSATPLLNFNGADGVTINGLNTGGNSLLIRNTGTGAAVQFINDSNDNILTNSTIEGGSTSGLISVSTGTTTGNDNIQITNNTIRDRSDAVGVPFNAINLIGTNLLGNTNTGLLVDNNQIFNFTQASVVVANSENVTITRNTVYQTAARTTALVAIGINSMIGTNDISQNIIRDMTTTLGTTGIALNDARGTTVTRNKIYNFPSTAGSTSTLNGILSNGASGTAASVTVANNFISLIPAFTNNQQVRGIVDFGFGGNTFSAFYNSVLIGGTSSGTSASWGCMRSFSAPTAFSLQNNICLNERTGGGANHFAVGDQSANTGTFVADTNIYVGTGVVAADFFDYGTASAGTAVTWVAWQTGPPTRDAASLQSNPVGAYTSALMYRDTIDLHLKDITSIARNIGTPVAITTDIDGQPRPNPSDPLVIQVDIGADEFLAPVASEVSVSGRVMTADGQGIKNAVISVQGGNLASPVFVRTASLGYYTVPQLQAGETYILTINSKRFVFSNPNRVLTVSDSIEGVDFTAEPQQ